jgi:hypothetical protein
VIDNRQPDLFAQPRRRTRAGPCPITPRTPDEAQLVAHLREADQRARAQIIPPAASGRGMTRAAFDRIFPARLPRLTYLDPPRTKRR